MDERKIMIFYALLMQSEGIEEAYKDFFKELEGVNEKAIKIIKKEYPDDVEFKKLAMISDFKLTLIKTTLMFKDAPQVKENLPMLAEELRKIAKELEDYKDEI